MNEGNASRREVTEIIHQFSIEGEFESLRPFGSGHINSTFLSVWDQAGLKRRYTHQRINDNVFPRPDQVMENIDRVTNHIREKISRSLSPPGGSGLGDCCTLRIVPSREGKLWVRDREGGWWRTYLFIEQSHTLELTASPDDARFFGESIAVFQNLLVDLDGPRLHETIPDFHNMEKRYARFYAALSKDSHNRAESIKTEIGFMRENEERGAVLIRSLQSGIIPERICHNDAKINNILVDDESSRALCIIDLDTVMPGTALFDLGDLIRTVTNRAMEDEQNLSKVAFDPVYFEALLGGYLSVAMKFLVPAELDLLCEAGRNITQIMGLRFLTDYLEGDHYYHTAHPDHNLDRCRTQIALMRSMDLHWEVALAIAHKSQRINL